MNHPSYETNKTFLDWLKEKRPGFEVKSDYCFVSNSQNQKVGPQPMLYRAMEVGDRRMCDCINTDTLHTILWKLFDVVDPYIQSFYESIDSKTDERIARHTLKSVENFAERLWHKYTNGKESLWLNDPDKVLEDIMKTYNELNT